VNILILNIIILKRGTLRNRTIRVNKNTILRWGWKNKRPQRANTTTLNSVRTIRTTPQQLNLNRHFFLRTAALSTRLGYGRPAALARFLAADF
jgi:hypothetical protein